MKKGWIRKKLSWIVSIGTFLLVSLAWVGLGLCQKPPKMTPELLNQGKTIYGKACIYCHGPNGDGKGPLSTNMKTPPADFTKPFSQWKNTKGDPRNIFQTIANGVPGTAMAKFHYSDEERWALAYTVMAFSQDRKN